MPVHSLPGFVDVAKALAHPARLRILAMLRGGPLCVCQLTAVLELAASTVSAHLSQLRRSGLLAERKQGKWVEYRLTDDTQIRQTLRRLFPLFEHDARIEQDASIMRALREVPPETLCEAGLDLGAVGVLPHPRRRPRHKGRLSIAGPTRRTPLPRA
jgi:DNA-binding transcriptional ArsR family regulator